MIPLSGPDYFSIVFEGRNVVTQVKYLIKVLKQVNEKKKIKREMKVLQNLAGGPDIITLLDVVRDPVSKYMHNLDFKVLYPCFSDLDVRYLLYVWACQGAFLGCDYVLLYGVSNDVWIGVGFLSFHIEM